MKKLILLRGLPGSGKTTLAKLIAPHNYHEADIYFTNNDGEYNFNPSLLPEAHQFCRDRVESDMINNTPIIVVSNTFVQKWTMRPYYELADKYNYKVFVFSLISQYQNIHNVPEEAIEKMRTKWEN